MGARRASAWIDEEISRRLILRPGGPRMRARRASQKKGARSRLRAAIGEERVRWTLFEDYDHADRRFETMHNCSLVLDQLEALLGRG